ncbi:innate immunity activator b [Chanos chanos]|uniref:Innate immunity activator b n=1 Tax=Chanos chanos TaxID=29144 RepID=A0A6J2VQ09_CHACN|nr:innate immunity activator protein-like [Chanos chanos]
MEGKEETSDTDSGIILHSGPDSPTTVMKDVSTHTRAVKLKQQSLQDRLELCLLELKKLCIREAELTGHLSSDYPLLPGEKPPVIRRRVGAAFKLDEQSILQKAEDSELCSVEGELALQQQICAAARRLCQEEHLSKAMKKSRMQQYKREEKKLKELQEAVFRLRLERGRSSPRPGMLIQRDQGTSDDSSLSDSAVLDEEEMTSQSSQQSSDLPPPTDHLLSAPGNSHLQPLFPGPSHPHLLFPIPSHPHSPLPASSHPHANLPASSPRPSELALHQSPPPVLEELKPCSSPVLETEPAPIQNSPWKESSLDQPYQKTKKSRSSSSKSSPAVTPVLPPLEACLGEGGLLLQSPRHLALKHTQSSSAPSTPDMHLRRGYSLRIPSSEPPCEPDLDRGRSRVARRRLTDFGASSSDYSPHRMNIGNPLYHSSSEDSSSEHSTPSCTSSPCVEHPAELHGSFRSHYPCHYPGHPDGHMQAYAQAYAPTSFYKTPQYQSSPNFFRGFVNGVRGYPSDMDTGRLCTSQLPPQACPAGRYEYWYEETHPHAQRVLKAPPSHIRLARAPSLREYPHHPSRVLPRQVVSEELKSWHQRNQFREPRPRSLDRQRQGAIRIRNIPGRESPLSQQHMLQEQQVPQRRVIQRATDEAPVQWFTEEDKEIVSQV